MEYAIAIVALIVTIFRGVKEEEKVERLNVRLESLEKEIADLKKQIGGGA